MFKDNFFHIFITLQLLDNFVILAGSFRKVGMRHSTSQASWMAQNRQRVEFVSKKNTNSI